MSLSVKSRADDCDKHQFDVNHMIFVNKKLYSAGDDGKIKMWADDLKFLNQVQAHTSSVFCLAASKDTLYSCSNDGTVKAWGLDELTPKKTILEDKEFEFWRISWENGYLFVGDNQGNVRVYENEKYYGVMNMAEPVKDMQVDGHILFIANLDITITDIKLQGLQNINRKNIVGRPPLSLAGSNLCFIDREGRDIIMHEKGAAEQWAEIAEVKGAHDMIIKAMAGVKWNNKIIIFTAGWDKVVKKWRLEDKKLKNGSSCNVDIVVNTLAIGAEGELYAGGGDGHIVSLHTI